VIAEAHGIPLAVSLTGGNRNHVTKLMPLIQAIPPVHGRRGRPGRARTRSTLTVAMIMTSTAGRSARQASRL
jgi:hypothetical protein